MGPRHLAADHRQHDNWVVAVGTSLASNGGVVWQVALAPAGPGIASRHGVWSTYIEVGTRQFVVDNASGSAQELRDGRVWRQWGPGTVPVAPPQAPPYAQQAPSSQPADNLAQRQREALQKAAGTENSLIVALGKLEEAARNDPTLSPAMKEAILDARSARGDVALSWAKLRDEFKTVPLPQPAKPVPSPKPAAVRPAAATQPAGPPVTPVETAARENFLQANAALQRAHVDFDKLRRNKEATLSEIADARLRVRESRLQEEAALVAYRRAQLEAEIDRAVAMDAPLRQPLFEAAEGILTLTRRQHRTQATLQDLRAEKADGRVRPDDATSGQLQQAASDLMDEMKALSSAQSRFDSLIAQASRKAPPPAGQSPAGEGGQAPPGNATRQVAEH